MTFTHTVTNLPAENQYPKLVRDKIPEIIKMNDGVSVPTRILTDDKEYEAAVRQKIIEEATELAAADTDDHTVEELADLEELVDELLTLKNIDRKRVNAAQDAKRQKRGGFKQRILMLEGVKTDKEE